MKVQSGSNYVIYIPDKPKRLVVYLHAHGDFPASRGRKSRTKYNFREEVAEAIYDKDTIAFAAKFGRGITDKVRDILSKYKITDLIISGWSVGGTDAVNLASYLANPKLNMKILLIDANYTNSIRGSVYSKLTGVPIYFVSDFVSKVKTKHISKIIDYGILKLYLKVQIPNGFKGSHHRYCRDSSLNNHLYNYIFGGELKGKYKLGHWDTKKKEIILDP